MEKRKRKRLRITLFALGAIMLATLAALALQLSNIQAFLAVRQHTAVEIEQMLEDNEARADKVLQKLPSVSVRPLTEDEKSKLRSGELTGDEVVGLIVQPQTSEPTNNPSYTDSTEPAQTQPNPAAPVASTTPEQIEISEAEASQARMGELIAKVYVLRESMTSQLDGILGSVKSEIASFPKKERTDAKKAEIAMRALSEASSLEHACDAQMNEILEELEALLKETVGDLSVTDEIRQIYANEKSLRKSYYLSLYS
jgi:hypothetical protein